LIEEKEESQNDKNIQYSPEQWLLSALLKVKRSQKTWLALNKVGSNLEVLKSHINKEQ
jgi:hypothetical protein